MPRTMLCGLVWGLIVGAVVHGPCADAHAAAQDARKVSPARDAGVPAAPDDGVGRIRGRILDLKNGQPVRQVAIRLAGSRLTEGRIVFTDADGRYDVSNLPAGQYTLEASRNGFVNISYGQRGPNERGRPLTIAAGQVLQSVDLFLPRGAVIAGRILDEYGEPAADVRVTALQQRWVNGRRTFVAAGRQALTNDIGQFRVSSLPPGTYVVRATRLSHGDSVVPDARAGYAPIYYPGTAESAAAQGVPVQIGEEAQADFQMSMARAVRVSGTVVDPAGTTVQSGAVTLDARNEKAVESHYMGTVKGDGTFNIPSVSPGTYVATFISRASANKEGDGMLTARADVVVAEEELSDVRLVATGGATVRGRVVFEGTQTATAGSGPSVTCKGSGGRGFSSGGTIAVVHPDNGRFVIRGVVDACVVTVDGGAWTLKSVRTGGVDATDRPIDVSRNSVDDVEVVVTNRVTTLRGRAVSTDGSSVPDYTVVVFPRDSERWQAASRFVRTARSDQRGEVTIKGLPAGDYWVIALTSFEDGAEHDAQILKTLVSKSMRTKLSEGDDLSLSMQLADRQ